MNGYNGSRGDPGFPGERGAPGPGGPPVSPPQLILMGILREKALQGDMCDVHNTQSSYKRARSMENEWGG